jgi:SAM-dependent methyltransferase
VTEPEYVTATRAAYDVVAVDYERLLRNELDASPLDRALLSVFAERVLDAGGGLVGDLGCGPGRLTGHLRDLGLDVFGIDLAPGMVDVARRSHPGLRFEVGALAGLDLPDASLAAAVAWYSIIHTPPDRLPEVFAEIARVIEPGGELVLAFKAGAGRHRIEQAYGHEVSYDVHWFEQADVAELLARAGFTVHTQVHREPERYEKGPRLTPRWRPASAFEESTELLAVQGLPRGGEVRLRVRRPLLLEGVEPAVGEGVLAGEARGPGDVAKPVPRHHGVLMLAEGVLHPLGGRGIRLGTGAEHRDRGLSGIPKPFGLLACLVKCEVALRGEGDALDLPDGAAEPLRVTPQEAPDDLPRGPVGIGHEGRRLGEGGERREQPGVPLTRERPLTVLQPGVVCRSQRGVDALTDRVGRDLRRLCVEEVVEAGLEDLGVARRGERLAEPAQLLAEGVRRFALEERTVGGQARAEAPCGDPHRVDRAGLGRPHGLVSPLELGFLGPEEVDQQAGGGPGGRVGRRGDGRIGRRIDGRIDG